MDLYLRRAQTNLDCKLLYKWVNEPLARKNAFNSVRISYSEHSKWFQCRLEDVDSVIYICSNPETNQFVGQIRVDFETGIGTIDYSVDSSCRGLGYGTTMLVQLPVKLKNDGFKFDKLIGRVKHFNIASEKAFANAGYLLVENNDMKVFEYRNL